MQINPAIYQELFDFTCAMKREQVWSDDKVCERTEFKPLLGKLMAEPGIAKYCWHYQDAKVEDFLHIYLSQLISRVQAKDQTTLVQRRNLSIFYRNTSSSL